MGFTALKDHWSSTAEENVSNARAVRHTFGDTPLFHDAASAPYTYEEALYVGHALQELRFEWFEEPLPDRDIDQLQALCSALDIPILAPETLMHEWELSALWLRLGATDLLRANARHGTTATLKASPLRSDAEQHNRIERPRRLVWTGARPSGLRHWKYALLRVSFPGGTRDEIGREIGLLNPPLPANGCVHPPEGSGWGAEWDRAYFEKKRIAQL